MKVPRSVVTSTAGCFKWVSVNVVLLASKELQVSWWWHKIEFNKKVFNGIQKLLYTKLNALKLLIFFFWGDENAAIDM